MPAGRPEVAATCLPLSSPPPCPPPLSQRQFHGALVIFRAETWEKAYQVSRAAGLSQKRMSPNGRLPSSLAAHRSPQPTTPADWCCRPWRDPCAVAPQNQPNFAGLLRRHGQSHVRPEKEHQVSCQTADRLSLFANSFFSSRCFADPPPFTRDKLSKQRRNVVRYAETAQRGSLGSHLR